MSAEQKLIFLYSQDLSAEVIKTLSDSGYIPVRLSDVSEARLLSAEANMISGDATLCAALETFEQMANDAAAEKSSVFRRFVKNLAKFKPRVSA